MNEIIHFHRNTKRWLIETFLKDTRIIDLGFGCGGDLHKYCDNGIQRIFAVEPSETNRKEAEKRIGSKALMEKGRFATWTKLITIIPCGAENTKAIMNVFAEKKESKMDAAVAFFSLTFAFQNEASLDQWIDTINRTVHSRGIFVGTVMDGARTYELLKPFLFNECFMLPSNAKEEKDGDKLSQQVTSDNTSHNNCFMVKRFKTDPGTCFGNELEIHLQNTIVENQTEYLMWFEILQKKLEKVGFELEVSQFFEPPENWPLEWKTFSGLNRFFVFRRIPQKQAKTS
jgi:hypothetical protein